MKFLCNQADLSKALSIVSKAVTTRTTIPILKAIMMEATEDGKLKLSASDLDLSIETSIDVNVEETGAITVNAKLFGDIIRKLPNEMVTFTSYDENKVLIKTLSSEFNIVSQSADEFPKIAAIEEPCEKISLDKDIFINMIKKTSFCASIDETKGIITGILMEINEEDFNMVALDGFRMAVTREKMRSQNSKKIVISARILNEIYKIIMETNTMSDINLVLGEKNAEILLDGTRVMMRLMDGEFISYNDILPKEHTIDIIVNRKALQESIERASLFAKEGRNNLIRCNIENNLLTITSTSEEGNVKEEIIINKDGDNLEIGFNSKFILDAIKVIDDEDIRMELTANIKPCIIKPVTGNTYEYLVLPVRIPSR